MVGVTEVWDVSHPTLTKRSANHFLSSQYSNNRYKPIPTRVKPSHIAINIIVLYIKG